MKFVCNIDNDSLIDYYQRNECKVRYVEERMGRMGVKQTKQPMALQ